MNTLRRILLPLLLIPAGMFMYVLIYPDWQWDNPGLQSLFVVVGIPIVIINLMAWFYPEIIQAYLPGLEHWGQREGRPATLAVALSALVAVSCVCVGAASAIAGNSPRPTFETSAVLPATETAFARSVRALSSATDNASEKVIVPTPKPSMEITLLSDATPEIPVSGAAATSTPVLFAAPAEAASTASGPTGTLSTRTTSTVRAAGSCTPATPDYVQAVGETVQDMDTENVVTTGWMVQSQAVPDVWFVAAKIRSDTGTTSLGVWGLFTYSDGSFDIYAINQPAIDLSSADSGDNSEPVLTMQTDGAQAASDCAGRAN